MKRENKSSTNFIYINFVIIGSELSFLNGHPENSSILGFQNNNKIINNDNNDEDDGNNHGQHTYDTYARYDLKSFINTNSSTPHIDLLTDEEFEAERG